MKRHILFNPISGNGQGEFNANQLCKELGGDTHMHDVTEISDYSLFFQSIDPSDELYLCGGDGTLNRFINDTDGIDFKNRLFYFATGSGNDFLRDVNLTEKKPFCINEYIQRLPTVTVNGKSYKFINGAGVGIDGVCCKMANEIRQRTKKPVSYTAVVIKCFLFHFKPTAATVTVDGKKYTYNRVWLATTMNGRYFGGGMLLTPHQDRLNSDGTVTFLALHNASKLKILSRFSSVFKGKHLKYTDILAFHTGHNIIVEFEKPFPLQIDGDIIENVSSYSVSTADCVVTVGAK